MNKITIILLPSIIILLTAWTNAYANIIFPAAFYLESRILTWWIICAGLFVEFILIRAFLVQNTTKAIFADIIMNAASTIAGIVLIPFAGLLWGLFSSKHSVSELLYISGIFILAVLINAVIEGKVINKAFNVYFGLKQFIVLVIANTMSVGIAGVSVLLNPPKI